MIVKLAEGLYLAACIIAVIFVGGVVSELVSNGAFVPQQLLAALVIWTIWRAVKYLLTRSGGKRDALRRAANVTPSAFGRSRV